MYTSCYVCLRKNVNDDKVNYWLRKLIFSKFPNVSFTIEEVSDCGLLDCGCYFSDIV